MFIHIAVPSKSGAKEYIKTGRFHTFSSRGVNWLRSRILCPVLIYKLFENSGVPLQRFLTAQIMMKMTSQKSAWTTLKVNKANRQFRDSGILFAPANGGKLCFALLTSFSAAQNRLPRRPSSGGKMHSEVAHLKIVKDRYKNKTAGF